MSKYVKNMLYQLPVILIPLSEPSEGEHRHQSTDNEKVVTSSNSAYGVVSASDDHEYEVIALAQMGTHPNMSTIGHSH